MYEAPLGLAEIRARLGSAWDLAVAQRTVAEVLGEQGHLADAQGTRPFTRGTVSVPASVIPGASGLV